MTGFDEVTIGDCRLIHADCREVLPTLGKFDLLLTDPPYGMNLDTNNSRFSGGTKGNIGKRGKGIGPALGAKIIGDDAPLGGVPASDLLSTSINHIVWGWNHYPALIPKGSCLVWIKRMDDAFGSFLSDAELAYKSGGCGVYCMRDLSNNAITKERSHPTQKPVGLMHWCLTFFASAKTVLDPFMGSGTTGVACAQSGRAFTGIERERKYFDIACERISRAYAQGKLFAPEIVKPQQAEITA